MAANQTGNAEIDQQHDLLDDVIAQLAAVCSGAPDTACPRCDVATREGCESTLASIVGELNALLVGHSAYEEKMMDLLPDNPKCRAHVKAHKSAHVGVLKELKRISGQADQGTPRERARRLADFAQHWLCDHAVMFDTRLVKFGEGRWPTIDFDGELVAMLDEHVFPNRPTRSMADSSAERVLRGRKLEVRGRFELLSPAQCKVFWLMVGGKTSREISDALGVSINTVKTHRAVVFAKMEVRSVVELIKKADMLR